MTPLSIAEIIRRRKEIAENLRGLKVMEANVYISDNGRIGVDEIVLTDGRGGLVTVAGDEESPIDMRLYTGGNDDPETWQSWSEALRRVCRCAAAARDRATSPPEHYIPDAGWMSPAPRHIWDAPHPWDAGAIPRPATKRKILPVTDVTPAARS